MIRFPYGIADFQKIRREGMFYVDRTRWLRELEHMGQTLVFLRPRRFGKSLWLQTLASYYDLRLADDFDALFGGLDAGRHPTPSHHRYFVLQWNFSEVSARGDTHALAERLHRYINHQIENFLIDYSGHLAGPVQIERDATNTLRHLLTSVRQTPFKLCLLVDEYDNFVNDVMVQDVAAYRALFDKDGPFKELFKSVKSGTEGQGIDKVFMTGVSPVALNDLTSGFNNADDVSHHPLLASLCGFQEHELRHALDQIASERNLPAEPDALLDVMRTWYNGYRFSEESEEKVYNPTSALYYLRHLADTGTPPKVLYDQNLRADRTKLSFIAQSRAGSAVIEQLTEGDGTLDIPRLQTAFSLEDLLTQVSDDPDAVASLLYYMGLLTRTGEVPPKLCIPNQVVRKLFLDRLLEIYLREPGQDYQARHAAMDFFKRGELAPLLDFFEQTMLPILSNRDRGARPTRPGLSGSGVNEMVIKALFLSILFDDTRYVAFSELELDRRYADLCLLVRPEMRRYRFFDVLFEFKLVRHAELSAKTEQLREMDNAALCALAPVHAALAQARQQIRRYQSALMHKFKDATPRCYAVVAVGLDRMVGEEVHAEGSA